jgi:hypothetical protein
MTAPSAPIDSDMPPGSSDIMWVLENGSILLTENLSTAGAATWAEKYTVTIFEAANNCSNASFLRVRAPEDNMVGVLVAAIASGDSDFTAYFLVSNSRGERGTHT